jgi:hypothetical protein
MRVSLHPKQALSGMLVACLCLLTAAVPRTGNDRLHPVGEPELAQACCGTCSNAAIAIPLGGKWVVPVDGTVYGDPKRFVDTYFSTAAGATRTAITGSPAASTT